MAASGSRTRRTATRSPVALTGFERAIRVYATKNEEPVTEIRFARCSCGGELFRVEADDAAGGAQRTCIACKASHLICDSAEYWDDAEPEACICTCDRDVFRLAVGFARHAGGRDVRWLYIGLRCEHCGVQGVYADWNIDYEPSHQLVDQV